MTDNAGRDKVVGYAPIIIVLVCGAVGFWIGGVLGCLLGLLAGYLGLIGVGQLSIKMSGGMLDRKLRQQIATSFVQTRSDLVRAALPEGDEAVRFLEIARLVDEIFERAATDNKSLDQNMALTRGAIRVAAQNLANEASDVPRRDLIVALEAHVEAEMYPSP